jgi:D-alanyl-D-alanine carboxypeptidase
MKRLILISLTLSFGTVSFSQTIPDNFQKLLKAYPQQIKGFESNKIIFIDGSVMIYDDGLQKTTQELLDNPDVEDQFEYIYKKGIPKHKPLKYQDPGRIRNIEFFKKIYGTTKEEVEKYLADIVWCPKLVNQKIKVTTINGIDKILIKMSAELDKHLEYQQYLKNIGGTFEWRNIAGTNRLSMHSFGMTMDINLKKTNYWQWDCNCQNEKANLVYKNKIPLGLVRIFEKYGFIWGGKWYHHDTMHFEYRPELLN